MRIAISGTANTGKTTLINDFLVSWPNYTFNKFSYREKLTEMPHSKSSNEDTQWFILNNMLDDLQKYSKTDHVIFDRCPLDNLIYSIWLNTQNKVTDEFVTKCVPLIKESMRLLDIIFFIPLTNASPIELEDNGVRDIDPIFISEIDSIFKAVIDQYHYNIDKTAFFPRDDSPGIIEIFGKPEERIYLIKQYLNVDGDVIGSEGDTILNAENLEQLSTLLQQQQGALASENFEKDQINALRQFLNAKTNRS